MFEGHPQAMLGFLRAQRAPSTTLLEIESEHLVSGHSPADLAIERGLFTRTSLLEALARHYGWAYEPRPPREIAADLAARITPVIARKFGVVPVRAGPQALELFARDPFDDRIITELVDALGLEIRLVLTDPRFVDGLIDAHYGRETAAAPSAETQTSGVWQAEGSSVAELVDDILVRAIRAGASDIHFEPFESDFTIRQRIDGGLRDQPSPPAHLAPSIISRLKVLAELNIAERRVPQDGRLRLELDGRSVDLRVSTLPTQSGESVVLRVLDPSSACLDLAALGLPASVRSGLDSVLRRPHGIVIVTGPTGSGKTTTLYASLRALNRPGLKVLTVEDPVEYEVEGVMQVQVLPSIGRNFAPILRSFLRQDPDVILVGEIRDSETAHVAMQAALTGHLVLTTLHTNDAPGAIARLVDMGIEPYLIASSVEAVLAQRLVRRICRNCRQPTTPSLNQWRWLEPDAERSPTVWEGAGCADCGGSGYHGRIGLFEWMPANDALREAIARGDSTAQLGKLACAGGMHTLRQNGLRAIRAGESTIEEILRYT